MDRRAFEPVLAVPVHDALIDRIRELGGRVRIVQPRARLLRYGGGLRTEDPAGKLLTGLAILGYTKDLLALIRAEQPAVVQCHSSRALITIGLAAILTRRPIVWYVKGVPETRMLALIGYRLATRIILQIEAMRDAAFPDLLKKVEYKVRVAGPGIDLEEVAAVESKDLNSLRASIGLTSQDANLVFLGIISPGKGLDILLQALLIVRDVVPRVKLYVLGDHVVDEYRRYRNTVEGFVEQNGLGKYVSFLGFRADALETLSLMDILVLPSLVEGVPKSIREAMALGKPVIATRVGAIPAIVKDHETGILVAAGDAGSLASAIIRLSTDASLRERLGRAAREFAFARFSMAQSIRRIETVYHELAGPAVVQARSGAD